MRAIKFVIKFLIVVIAIIVFMNASLYAQEKRLINIEKRIEYLQKQIDELKRILNMDKQKNQFKRKAYRKELVKLKSKKSVEFVNPYGIKISFGGQYRINFYNARNEGNNILLDHDDQRAARLRIRQNIDIKFNNNFSTYLQIELQHTSDNITTTDLRLGNKSTELSVRHAVMEYISRDGIVLKAGILPLHDYFHDTLFSSNWDYNPVAGSLIFPVGKGKLRIFGANLKEGEENISQDDFIHYQIDYIVNIHKYQFVFSGTALNLQQDPSYGKDDGWHYNYGFSYSFPFKNSWNINGFLVGSYTDRKLLGTKNNAHGIAIFAELVGNLGKGRFGFLISHATGDKHGEGFLPPMAFAKTFGYWGYTGILTVQGPTDTGFDFDGVNISNNGLGLTTVQIKYQFPLIYKLYGYTAIGWFGNTNPPERRSNMLGIDLLAIGTYKLNNYLKLDLGIAYAHLKDSVSGYFQGVQHAGKVLFNQDVGKTRDKFVTFGRLQAEF